MSIFDLKEDEEALEKFLQAQFAKALAQYEPKLEAFIKEQLTSVLGGIEASLEEKFSAVLADKLGVSRDLVTKTLSDVFDGKVASLPGDVISGVEELLKKQTGGLL